MKGSTTQTKLPQKPTFYTQTYTMLKTMGIVLSPRLKTMPIVLSPRTQNFVDSKNAVERG